MEMTSRERILAALRHEKTDLLPIDFGGMRSTGINALAYQRLKKHLGMNIDKPFKLYDVFQQLAEPELEIVKRMGGDVVQAHRFCPAFGIKIDAWKPGKLQDGSQCLVPRDYNPAMNERGEQEIRSGKITIAKMPATGLYFDQVHHPYEKVETIAEIDQIEIPEVSEAELRFLEQEARDLYENTDQAVLFAFGGNIFEAGQINWGYEKFFIDLSLNPDLVHYYFQKITDAYMRDLEKIMPVIGKYIHLIQFGDDLGTQEALQISPRMYREMIKPYHARQYQFIRNNYPKVKVFLHSCGAIYDLIPDLIDTGVEVLNPVQISAKGMDPVRLKKEFGNQLTFWGGGANMQYTVPGGTIEQIKREVRELIAIFAPGGGYVFNQVHNIQANIPPEKIMAIYDTALEFRNFLK
jgi:uroporphyrinogen decarboxylase